MLARPAGAAVRLYDRPQSVTGPAAVGGAPTGAKLWLAGARPRTLPAAIVPVLVGTGAASAAGHVIWWRAALAMTVSLAIQVGTNYANDYSDGIRGTDDVRVGPLRLTASGLVPAKAVKRAALASFLVAAVAGVVLSVVVSPWLLVVGAACLAAGWLYTGGPKPYGYAGLGEIFVFVFFGLVAVVGSTYVHVERITGTAVVASLPVGLLATALLIVNNLRDIPTDTAVGKRTLAVRIGDPATRASYVGAVCLPFVLLAPLALFRPWAALAALSFPFVVPVLRGVREGRGPQLIPVLQGTARLQLVFGALLAIGLFL